MNNSPKPGETDPPRLPISGWLLNLILLGCSVFFALLCAEIALRVVHHKTLSFDDRPFRPSSWVLKPNTHDVSYAGASVSINNLGMRGPDATLAKPPGTFRILGVGDSITFGYGLEDRDIFLRVLERNLNHTAAGIHYQVLNTGIPGTGLDFYTHIVETRVPELRPDLILVCMTMNDIDPELLLEAREPVGKHLAAQHAGQFLLEHSYLFNAMYVPAKSILYRLNILKLKNNEGFGFLAIEPRSPQQDQARHMMDLYLARLARDAKAFNIPLAVVVFPVEPQLSDDARKTYADKLHVSFPPEVTSGTPQRWVEEDGRHDGFPVLDLLPTLRAVPGNAFLRNRSISVDPVHPSLAGDAAVGDALTVFLRQNGLTPR